MHKPVTENKRSTDAFVAGVKKTHNAYVDKCGNCCKQDMHEGLEVGKSSNRRLNPEVDNALFTAFHASATEIPLNLLFNDVIDGFFRSRCNNRVTFVECIGFRAELKQTGRIRTIFIYS